MMSLGNFVLIKSLDAHGEWINQVYHDQVFIRLAIAVDSVSELFGCRGITRKLFLCSR